MRSHNLSAILLYTSLLFYSHSPLAAAYGEQEKETAPPQWSTHYFGRFKIDLPTESEIASDYKLYNEKIELISKNAASELPSIINKKTDELKKGMAYGTSSKYEKTVALNDGSVLILSKLGNFYTFHAYLLTSKNTLYRMLVQSISAKGIDGAINKTRLISESVYFRHPQDAPPREVFALEEGYTTLSAHQSLESIDMGAQISKHPGTFVSLLTQRIAERDDSLIKRFENGDWRGFASGKNEVLHRSKILRKRARMIDGLEAEEIAIVTLADGKRFYTFQIEYEGLLKSNTTPFVELRLGTHEIGSDFKSDEEALAFWDRMADSLKRMP